MADGLLYISIKVCKVGQQMTEMLYRCKGVAMQLQCCFKQQGGPRSTSRCRLQLIVSKIEEIFKVKRAKTSKIWLQTASPFFVAISRHKGVRLQPIRNNSSVIQFQDFLVNKTVMLAICIDILAVSYFWESELVTVINVLIMLQQSCGWRTRLRSLPLTNIPTAFCC